jgi:hypothetical protein
MQKKDRIWDEVSGSREEAALGRHSNSVRCRSVPSTPSDRAGRPIVGASSEQPHRMPRVQRDNRNVRRSSIRKFSARQGGASYICAPTQKSSHVIRTKRSFTPPTHSKWPPWISTTSFGRLTRPSMPYPKKSAISKSSPAPGSPRDLHPSSCRMDLCPGSRPPFAACQHALIQHEIHTAGPPTASSSASMTTSSSRSRRSRR